MQNHRCKILGLLALALTLLLGVSGPVTAQPYVLINQQVALAGGVSPGDTPGFPVTISEPGTYVLNGPLTVPRPMAANDPLNGIVIGANNVTLNCDGEVVVGSDPDPNNLSLCPDAADCAGIFLESRSLVTVENCPVTNFKDGFVLRGSTNNVFRMNRVENNTDDGFQLERSSANFFIQNTVRMNRDDGFDMEVSKENFFTRNDVSRNTENGFALDDLSDNNVFVQNTVNNNAPGRTNRHGFSIERSSANLFISNTANRNGGQGFRLETSSNGNTLHDNVACLNMSGVDVIQISSSMNVFSSSNSFCRPIQTVP